MLAGLFGIWLIWRLRREETPALASADEGVADDTPSLDTADASHLEQEE